MIPTALQKGDTILVAASAGAVDLKRLKTSMDLLKDQFNFRVPESIDRRFRYLAGTDEERAEEINNGLGDPDVRGIWVARGGFGLTRILHLLDPEPIQNDPKPIIGYSDVTALHAWSHHHGLRGIHGPVLNFLDTCKQEDLEHLTDQLLGNHQDVFCDVTFGQSSTASRGLPSEAKTLVGGNLSVISHLIGTDYQLDTSKGFLLLEDVGEKPYALDRTMTQLMHSKSLDGCEGVLFGDFEKCDAGNVNGLDTVLERSRDFGVPHCSGLPVGHGDRNKSFSYGGKVKVLGDGLVLVDPLTEKR